jgi:hypothetical protein
MSVSKLSEIDSVRELFQDPRCIERLNDALQNATRPESAEEFLARTSIQTRLGAAAGKKLFKELGIQSRTESAADVSGPYAYVLLALVCGIVQQAMTVTEIDERTEAADCVVVATVPSSALSFTGEFSAHVTQRNPGYHIEASVTFPGQKFAWGRGKRILKTLFQDIESRVSDFTAAGL